MQLHDWQAMQMTLVNPKSHARKKPLLPGKNIHFKGQTHEKSLDNKIIKKSG